MLAYLVSSLAWEHPKLRANALTVHGRDDALIKEVLSMGEVQSQYILTYGKKKGYKGAILPSAQPLPARSCPCRLRILISSRMRVNRQTAYRCDIGRTAPVRTPWSRSLGVQLNNDICVRRKKDRPQWRPGTGDHLTGESTFEAFADIARGSYENRTSLSIHITRLNIGTHGRRRYSGMHGIVAKHRGKCLDGRRMKPFSPSSGLVRKRVGCTGTGHDNCRTLGFA